MWGSFFFSGFSFFFTLRPAKAVVVAGIFFIAVFAGYFAIEREVLPQPLDVFLVIGLLFAPILINTCLLVVHERRLRHSDEKTEEQALELVEEIASLLD